MAFSVGDNVWACDRELHSWVVADITAIDPKGGLITVTTNDPARKAIGATLEKLRPEIDVQTIIGNLDTEQTAKDTSDLLNLPILADSSLIRCLYLRYMKDIIYTDIGAIVVALNPFNFKIPRYMDDQMPRYLDQGEGKNEALVPHSWQIAHSSFYEMMNGGKDPAPQFILVSGESGAGKTEASKIVVKYLGRLSDRASAAIAADGAAGGGGAATSSAAGADANGESEAAKVGQRLTSCSPILESFGNARTVRNDNSSRFGKFMKIQFSKDGVLLGARITRYLLEKSRIITAAKNERCYHAFYLVLRGKYRKEFGLLEDETKYRSLNSGGQLSNSDFDTQADANEVLDAMAIVGLDEMAQTSVWATVAAIITIVNVDFISDGGEGSQVADGPMRDALSKAASLFSVDGAQLLNELVKSESVLRGETTVKLHKPSQAADIRDALCKHSYDGLFLELCERCNKICDAKTSDAFWIGLLDIFGFEDFEKNSFEQLCINLANETLQGHYNEYIFVKDMDECRAEGIDVADIKCPDNTPCLQMVSDPKAGIFALLDDECSLGKGSDKGFLDCIVAKFKTHDDFAHFKVSRVPSFGVKHYAGMVTYDVTGWLDKNRDTLKDSLRLLMRNSANNLIKGLIAAPVERTGRAVTVSGFFASQIGELMAVINSSNPHWIRCIKPHPVKKPLMFHGVSTMSQLESSGVLGTVKIRKAGYPVRLPFLMFLQRFSILMPRKDEATLTKAASAMTVAAGREKVLALLKSGSFAATCPMPKMCQIGKTKVFLKSEAMTPLEKLRKDETTRRVVCVQKAGRGYILRKQANRDRRQQVQRLCAELLVKEWRAMLQRTAVARALKAERDKAFRAAMLAGTTALETAFRERARDVFDESRAQLVNVFVDITLQLEPLLRQEHKRHQSAQWLHLLTSLGYEMLSVNERAARERVQRHWALLFNLLLAEHIEHRIFVLLLDERDHRAPMEKALLEELSVKAGDVEVRITLLLGREKYLRSQIRSEGLGVYAGWLGRHNATRSSGFFEKEQEARRAIAEEQLFERDVRKRFERTRIWVALTASLFADEEYDRSFLVGSEKRYRKEIVELQRKTMRGGVGDDRARAKVEETEAAGRCEMAVLESSLRDSMVLAERDDKLAVMMDDIEFDEFKLRGIVKEAFFATLAVVAEEDYPALYRDFMYWCRRGSQ